MDDLLPSYESAIRRDPWILVAPYLPSQDLCSATLVCKKWHGIFTKSLWGNPASHFGVQNDTVYVALTRFKRTLPYVRASVRELTHTLCFPPAHAELYEGPHAEWLRDCLEYLPRLQCLIVDGLPFFDHACLLSLRHPSLRRSSLRPAEFPVFSLRLLDASGCTNATSTGLAEALPHFPDLVSLDLSKTAAARGKAVFSAFKYLRNLRVLNLRGLGLKDVDFSVIAHSIGSRVRSLDVSENYLTDASARLLLECCLKETVVRVHNSRGPLPPVEHEQSGNDMNLFEAENLVGHLRKKLTGGFVGSLAIEEARDVGITHLFISGNAITVEGISGLLLSGRLNVLDAGILPAVIKNTLSGEQEAEMVLPGVSKLTPVLSEYASLKLKYLRINYQVVTEDSPREPALSPRAELSGDFGKYIPLNAHELEVVEPPTSELEAESTAVVEAPGDFSYPVELPGSLPSHGRSDGPSLDRGDSDSDERHANPAPKTKVTSNPLNVKKGPAYAPEPVWVDSPSTPVSTLSGNDENGNPSLARAVRDPQICLSPLTPASDGNISNSPLAPFAVRSRGSSFYFIEDRRARLEFRQSSENRLHPGMLPKLHTLVLTDVPTTTTDMRIINRLTQYISDAAEEAAIARQRARHTYMLPPGRSRAIAEKEYASSLFALRRVVLEMAPPQAAPKKISTSWRAYPTKSTTEDTDSEAFWEAAAYDFSFFDDEECGLPGRESDRTLPLTAMSGLELAPNHTVPPSKPEKVERGRGPLLDVVEEIGKFRREKKAAYNNLVQMGEADPEVEGYWPGAITIFRKPANVETGELDCYGNRYESGWYYR
ncbi:hypothetical protein BDW02DRAFT_598741 [Decorospora gaudefroyi]|uniref:F-box domain-containing protein n=1 Tax=Decorospora gaudefroyi TaxID=184978 RepID=A0A6A5K8Z6_9PLEO|nr:hypothetical protein BDW02DRAFT_598741 [Decorospora gaudefroyi]